MIYDDCDYTRHFVDPPAGHRSVSDFVRHAGRFDALILPDPGAAASANHVAPLPGRGLCQNRLISETPYSPGTCPVCSRQFGAAIFDPISRADRPAETSDSSSEWKSQLPRPTWPNPLGLRRYATPGKGALEHEHTTRVSRLHRQAVRARNRFRQRGSLGVLTPPVGERIVNCASIHGYSCSSPTLTPVVRSAVAFSWPNSPVPSTSQCRHTCGIWCSYWPVSLQTTQRNYYADGSRLLPLLGRSLHCHGNSINGG